MNLIYLIGGLGFIAWFVTSILSRSLIEENKKAIISVIVVLIVLGIYVFPNYGEMLTMFFAGCFLGEYVYKKLFEKKVEETKEKKEETEKKVNTEEQKSKE